jgi:hypothetical protein
MPRRAPTLTPLPPPKVASAEGAALLSGRKIWKM